MFINFDKDMQFKIIFKKFVYVKIGIYLCFAINFL